MGSNISIGFYPKNPVYVSLYSDDLLFRNHHLCRPTYQNQSRGNNSSCSSNSLSFAALTTQRVELIFFFHFRDVLAKNYKAEDEWRV